MDELIADYLELNSWRHLLWRSLEVGARNATSNALQWRYFDEVNKDTQRTNVTKNGSTSQCSDKKNCHLHIYEALTIFLDSSLTNFCCGRAYYLSFVFAEQAADI